MAWMGAYQMSQIKKPPIVLSGFSSRRKFFSEFADSLLNSGGGTTGARTHTIPLLLLGEVSPNNPSPLESGVELPRPEKDRARFLCHTLHNSTVIVLLSYCRRARAEHLSRSRLIPKLDRPLKASELV